MNKLLLLLVVCLGAQVALASEGSGAHGADIEADQNNIWFLGPEEIQYCISIEAGSTLVKADARTLIIDGFADWRLFFAKTGYLEKEFGHKHALPSPFDVEFPDKKPRAMSIHPHEVEKCTDPAHQLEFRFSKSSETNWSLDANHAYGAAIRGPYDHKTFRTGGVIWISDSLKTPLERKHVLLHELGHIFGMPHNSTYVMYEKIGRLILMTQNLPRVEAGLGMIESPSWKYLIRPNTVLTLESLEASGIGTGRFGGTSPFLGMPPSTLIPFVAGVTKLTYVGAQNDGSFTYSINLGFNAGGNRMTGTFYRRYHHYDVGPSIHTRWLKDGQLAESRVHLEMLLRAQIRNDIGGGSKQIPLEGAFTDGKGYTYPAIIEFPFGAVVKLFDIKTATWYSLSSFPYEQAP